MKIAILGGAGRMGRMLIETVRETEGVALSGVTERPGGEAVGRDAGALIGAGSLGVAVTGDALEVFAAADAVIDFTLPDAVLAHAELAAQARLIHVIGATGFQDHHFEALEAAAHHSVQIRAGNMSLGVNLLTMLTETVAKALDADFDIEIVESHHRHKIDAPSGTALMLGEAAARGRGVDLAAQSDRGRDGVTGARQRGRIGFAALRGGDVVGEHDVVFAGLGERIVLRHIATDRAIFARGAVKAALWGQGRAPGAYDMIDVLGLRS
ncbi:MAG: 4-hydroxy-tetrahydrodipicolinate reductase [Pseudomonadota bacterium]